MNAYVCGDLVYPVDEFGFVVVNYNLRKGSMLLRHAVLKDASTDCLPTLRCPAAVARPQTNVRCLSKSLQRITPSLTASNAPSKDKFITINSMPRSWFDVVLVVDSPLPRHQCPNRPEQCALARDYNVAPVIPRQSGLCLQRAPRLIVLYLKSLIGLIVRGETKSHGPAGPHLGIRSYWCSADMYCVPPGPSHAARNPIATPLRGRWCNG